MELETPKNGRTKPKTTPSRAKKEPTEKGSEGKQTTFERRRLSRLHGLFANQELVSFVCELHVKGVKNTEIADALKEAYPELTIKREDPYWIVRKAAERGWLVFRPPHHGRYRRAITDKFPKLERVEVIASTAVETVAREAARVLLKMLRQFNRSRTVIHVGLAGGHTLRSVIRALALEMHAPVQDLPKVVHFHALAAGFNPDDPSTNPNSFVSFFQGELLPCEFRFTGLSAPAIVSPGFLKGLREFDDIKEAFDSVRNIDIFVTSGATWHDDSVLLKRMPKKDREKLERNEVTGDLLWRPVGPQGPIEEVTSRRAFTLVELNQLQRFIRDDNKKVLVTFAPCGLCGELKGKLLKCIVEQDLATHVVVDTRSAGQLLGLLPKRPGD